MNAISTRKVPWYFNTKILLALITALMASLIVLGKLRNSKEQEERGVPTAALEKAGASRTNIILSVSTKGRHGYIVLNDDVHPRMEITRANIMSALNEFEQTNGVRVLMWQEHFGYPFSGIVTKGLTVVFDEVK